MTSPSISSARPDPCGSSDLVDKLEELRSHFDQIQGIAAEGQRLLAALAPQLEKFASRMADLETMVDRWKGQADSREEAA